MYAFLGRITKPYCDLSGMFLEWSKQCSSIWVYEHEADDKVSRTHCHLFIIGSERDADGLKKLNSWKNLKIDKGNKGSSFKTYNKINDLLNDGWYSFLAYCSKGNLLPKYANGENVNEIAEKSLANWVDNVSTKANANVNVIIEKKSNRVTQYQIAELAQTIYMEEHKESFLLMNGSMCVRRLIRIVIRLLKQNRILAHKRLVANICQHIRASLDPDRFVEEIYSMV
jgi:hypothetical protein